MKYNQSGKKLSLQLVYVQRVPHSYLYYYLKTFSDFVAYLLATFKANLASTEYLNITDYEPSPDQCIHEGHRKLNSSI